jgi:hypothetical protein
MIMGMQVLDYKAICKLPFGAHVQVHEDPQITNTLEPKTTGGINLGPCNMQGGHKFLNLATGEVMVHRKWTELPVPSEVILRLEELSTDEANDVVDNILQENIENIEEEDNGVVTSETSEEKQIEHDEEANIMEPEERGRREDEESNTDDVDSGAYAASNNEAYNTDEAPVAVEPVSEEERLEHEINQEQDQGEERESLLDQTMKTSNTSSRNNLRPNRTPNYLRRFAFLSVQAGIKRWGNKAREAARDELRLFIKEKVFKGLRRLTAAQMRKALMIHCFLVEKRDGHIKARAVADGRG